MKITRYPQSCLLIEKGSERIVIDPGKFFAEKYTVDELGEVSAALYTHEHPDHYHPEIAKALRSKGVMLYANQSTAKLVGECTVVHDGDMFEVGSVTVQARELRHCLLPTGKKGPQNTGYLIDTVFFHPGDGKEITNLKADAMALPIAGPDISMLDAFTFAKQLGVKMAIPIHYDWIKVDPQSYQEFSRFTDMPFELRILKDGESTEV